MEEDKKTCANCGKDLCEDCTCSCSEGKNCKDDCVCGPGCEACGCKPAEDKPAE